MRFRVFLILFSFVLIAFSIGFTAEQHYKIEFLRARLDVINLEAEQCKDAYEKRSKRIQELVEQLSREYNFEAAGPETQGTFEGAWSPR